MNDLAKMIVTICLLGFGARMYGQTGIPASGGNASGGGATVTYSVGQVFYDSKTGSNGSEIQGIQQPLEISVVTAVENAEGISLEFSIYPNPATDIIKLKTGNFNVLNLRFQLYDIRGNLLLDKKTEVEETSINLQGFVPASYFLKVIQGDKEIKSFKIIKH